MENQKENVSYPNPLKDSDDILFKRLKDELRKPNNQTMVLEFESEHVSIHWGLN